jgi:hypothetical protein
MAMWVMLLVIVFVLAVIAALLWRSAWWTEAGPPLPRGTERHLLLPDQV